MEELDEELICAVCRDILVDPLTLPCGHNYCENCVSELKRSAVADEGFHPMTQFYTCPLCLAPCDSKIHLKKNVILNNIIEKYHLRRASSIDCSVCKGEHKTAAEKTCVNCNESYCTVHVMPHLENSTLRLHVLVSPVSDASKLCKEHGKDLQLFCETDSTPLCAYCMLPSETKHGHGHSVVTLADAWKCLRRDCHVRLEGIAQSVSEVNDSLEKTDEDVSRSEESLVNQQQECSAFLSRVRLFLDMEEKAWTQRFSVDRVQLRRLGKHKTETLKRLRAKLCQSQSALLEVENLTDPIVMTQLLQDVEYLDVCCSPFQNSRRTLPQPVASARITPLFKTLQAAFPRDHIYFHQPSAHPRLRLSPDRTSVWMAEEDGLDPTSTQEDRPLYVLGGAIFTEGVHHWEVAVSGLSSWALGVAFLAPRQTTLSRELGANGHSWGLSYDESKCQRFCAKHDWEIFSFSLTDRCPPGRIGVFLDADSGILCFYDADGHQNLHTFYCGLHQHAGRSLYPVFCPRLRGDDRPASSEAMRVL